MTRHTTLSPRTTMAISAVLLLSTGMAHAQEAALDMTVVQAPAPTPVIAVPTTPATAPTIVLPVPAAEPPVPAREVQDVSPAPVARTPRAAPTAPRAVSRAQSVAQPVSAATPALPAPSPTVAAPVVAQPTATAVTPVAEPAAPTLVRPADATSDWAIPVGAAATLLVLGGVAFAATRRRRVWEVDADFVPPVVNRPTPRPEVSPTPQAERATSSAAMRVATTTATTPDERADLIDRMVASPPDAINPFTSRKARRRRARLIVQSMRHDTTAPAPVRAEPAAERPLQPHRVLVDA
ncbi:MAG: hypothetical protein ACKOVA_11660 [Novosphingobium sp.]